MSEMVELTENIGGKLRWSSMADNAGFGLEYLLHDIMDERTIKLLEEGVRFCTLLITGDSEVPSNYTGLEAHLMTKTLSINIDNSSGKTSKEIIEEAKQVKEALLQAINEHKKFDEKQIRKMQHFFNERSTPVLRAAFNDIRKFETTRRKSTNVHLGRIAASRFA